MDQSGSLLISREKRVVDSFMTLIPLDTREHNPIEIRFLIEGNVISYSE